MPPDLVERLSEPSAAALRSILGKKVWLIYSSALEVSALDNVLVAHEIFLPVEEDGFLVMANDGFYDSPIAHVSYYSIGIARSTKPAGLNMTYNSHGVASIGSGVSQVAFPHPVREPKLCITKVEVYETVVREETLSGQRETVRYDKAICLYREDGMKILFRLEDSIRASFQILFTESQVLAGLSNLGLRASWEA